MNIQLVFVCNGLKKNKVKKEKGVDRINLEVKVGYSAASRDSCMIYEGCRILKSTKLFFFSCDALLRGLSLILCCSHI